MQLVIDEGAYRLQPGGETPGPEIVLEGGASALLPPGRSVDALALEHGIEIAENWLMPHVAPLRGEMLDVADTTGRLCSGMAAVLSVSAAAWDTATLEQHFISLVGLLTGRVQPASLDCRTAFVADLLLLRELAHHGRLAGVRLVG